jgi:Ca2+/Na+ antiporter
LRELFDEKEEGWFNNLLLIPIKILLVLTVPYSHNPLMIGRLKYLPLTGWIVVTGGAIFHFKHHWQSLFIAAGVSLAPFLVINRLLKQTRIPKMLFDFVSFITILAWIKLVVSIMMDYLIFFSFYFSVSEIIVFTVIVSAGNSINEVLTTYALSKAGFGIMALISLFSGQFLNMVLSLGTNIHFSRNKTSAEFDIFGLYPEHPLHGEHLVAAQFMRALTGCVIFGLVTHFVATWLMKYELKRRFASFMLVLYVIFVALTINFHVSMNKKAPIGH